MVEANLENRIDTRNYGIDLLRIISMIMVIIVHIVDIGGNQMIGITTKTNEFIGRFLFACCFCAVNCFGIISGYVGYKAKHKYANLLYLIIQVMFILLVITIIYQIRYPNYCTVNDWLGAVFPFALGPVWYFRAYFCMFFFIPFMNLLIDKLSKKQSILLLSSIILLFVIIPTFVSKDIYFTNNGLSPLWLSFLYLFGAFFSKYKIEVKDKIWLFLGFFICASLSYIWGLFSINFIIFKTFLNYTSPTLLICACCLVLLFSNVKINVLLKKIIKFFAPLAFGVYVIHIHPYVWNHIMYKIFEGYGTLHPALFTLSLIFTAIALFVIFALMDYIRLLLFKLCRVKEFCNFIEKKIRNICSKIFKEKDEEENKDEETENEIVN